MYLAVTVSWWEDGANYRAYLQQSLFEVAKDLKLGDGFTFQ